MNTPLKEFSVTFAYVATLHSVGERHFYPNRIQEKRLRPADLIIANKELALKNKEKEKFSKPIQPIQKDANFGLN